MTDYKTNGTLDYDGLRYVELVKRLKHVLKLSMDEACKKYTYDEALKYDPISSNIIESIKIIDKLIDNHMVRKQYEHICKVKENPT